MFGIGKALERWNYYRKVSPLIDAIEEGVVTQQWRKALAAALGIIVTLWGPTIGLTHDQIQGIVGALMAFIVGQGLADLGKNAKNGAK